MKVSWKTVDNLPISIREMQAYGAACLVKFCSSRGIESPHVSLLVRHLLDLMTSSDLPDWESKGAVLELSGRGDPIPDALLNVIRSSDLEDFSRLVDSVVEVGLVDMYGAETRQPLRFLNLAREILGGIGLTPPSIEELCLLSGRDQGWGAPLAKERAKKIEAWCLSHFRPE